MTIYEVAVKGHIGTDNFVNVFHFWNLGFDPAPVGSAWVASCETSYLACMDIAYTLDEVVTTNLATHVQATAVRNQPGTLLGQALPPQVAALISWRTGYVGRKYRGRTYLPAQSESYNQAGVVDPALLTLMAGFVSDMLNVWGPAASGSFVLYHKADDTYNVITAGIPREIYYTQRRRTPGVGS